MRFLTLVTFLVVAITSPTPGLSNPMAGHPLGNVTPSKKVSRVVVLGDSLGEGIWSGLYWAFKPERNIEVVKVAQLSTGLVREDRFNWLRTVRELIDSRQIDVAVFMVGTNDNQAIRRDDTIISLLSPTWRTEYSKRVDAILEEFKNAEIPVFWIGLPVMRPSGYMRMARELNDIFRERADLAGVPYVSTWEAFADQDGRYTPYAQDAGGRARLMRAKDGVHFTPRGYRRLASLVEDQIRTQIEHPQVASLQTDDIAPSQGEDTKLIVTDVDSSSEQSSGQPSGQSDGVIVQAYVAPSERDTPQSTSDNAVLPTSVVSHIILLPSEERLRIVRRQTSNYALHADWYGTKSRSLGNGSSRDPEW